MTDTFVYYAHGDDNNVSAVQIFYVGAGYTIRDVKVANDVMKPGYILTTYPSSSKNKVQYERNKTDNSYIHRS